MFPFQRLGNYVKPFLCRFVERIKFIVYLTHTLPFDSSPNENPKSFKIERCKFSYMRSYRFQHINKIMYQQGPNAEKRLMNLLLGQIDKAILFPHILCFSCDFQLM